MEKDKDLEDFTRVHFVVIFALEIYCANISFWVKGVTEKIETSEVWPQWNGIVYIFVTPTLVVKEHFLSNFML